MLFRPSNACAGSCTSWSRTRSPTAVGCAMLSHDLHHPLPSRSAPPSQRLLPGVGQSAPAMSRPSAAFRCSSRQASTGSTVTATNFRDQTRRNDLAVGVSVDASEIHQSRPGFPHEIGRLIVDRRLGQEACQLNIAHQNPGIRKEGRPVAAFVATGSHADTVDVRQHNQIDTRNRKAGVRKKLLDRRLTGSPQ